MARHTGSTLSDDIMEDFVAFPLSVYAMHDPDYLTILDESPWTTKSPTLEQDLITPHQTFIQYSPIRNDSSEASTRPGTPPMDQCEGTNSNELLKYCKRDTNFNDLLCEPLDRNMSISSTSSGESVSGIDPHHEGSCAKCRMTEAEARKCRLERRREQNRASQRKFRARKEAKIREAASQVATLETYVDFLERHNGDLEATNSDLRAQVDKLKQSAASKSTSKRHPRPNPHHSHSSHSITSARPESPAHGLFLPLFDHELQPPYPGKSQH